MNKANTNLYLQLVFIFAVAFSGCKVYKQNVILQSESTIKAETFEGEVSKIEGAYEIKPGDRLSIEVYTNKGERVIDPNFELSAISGRGTTGAAGLPDKIFEVLPNGTAILPLLGGLKVEGYTIEGLQKLLIEEYAHYYIQPYVRVRSLNRRVVLLGALGGQVIPLENEQMTVLEVLALAGGLNRDSKGQNIRLIRGPLNSPSVQIINLETIEGMQQANLAVLPNDIIYVEPIRRVFTESLRDIAPVLGVITNVVTLLVVIQNLN